MCLVYEGDIHKAKHLGLVAHALYPCDGDRQSNVTAAHSRRVDAKRSLRPRKHDFFCVLLQQLFDMREDEDARLWPPQHDVFAKLGNHMAFAAARRHNNAWIAGVIFQPRKEHSYCSLLIVA